MDGRKKQRKKIPVRKEDFGHKWVFDRHERHLEDLVEWEIFQTQEKKMLDLLSIVALIRNLAKIPSLKPQKDLISVNEHGYGPYVPKSYSLGVLSHYLWKNKGVEDLLHKLIRTNILVPYRWSYNFYPVIEYMVLYGKLPSNEYFYANPMLFELFKDRPKELLRTGISTSDIRFLRERLRRFCISGKKATKEGVKILERYNEMIDVISLRRQHLPKNIAFKICAFRLFREVSVSRKQEQIVEGDFNSDHFIKNQIEDFKTLYSEWSDSGFPYNPHLTDKSIHNALKKLHSEYKELLTK